MCIKPIDNKSIFNDNLVGIPKPLIIRVVLRGETVNQRILSVRNSGQLKHPGVVARRA